MHRLAAIPGGWNPNTEGVIIIDQTPAEIILLTAADTDIQSVANALSHKSDGLPSLRVAHLLNLQQPFTIDDYSDKVLSQARVIILRLLGGQSYWPYGLEVLKELAQAQEIALFVLPGDDNPDPSLISHSTVSLALANQLWRYFQEGGAQNWGESLKWLANQYFSTSFAVQAPQSVPKVDVYHSSSLANPLAQVAILFYRSHYLCGNTRPIDAMCQALESRNLEAIAIYVSSLRETDVQEAVLTALSAQVSVVLNTTSFSLAQLQREAGEPDLIPLWQALNIPVLQVILSGGTFAQWQESFQGLNPRDMAMNVALPEVDGRIITRAISFKSVDQWRSELQSDLVVYEPEPSRVDWLAELALNFVRCGQTPKQNRKIALILANYPNKDGRLANGVGLDTPLSCVRLLHALQSQGYRVENLPLDGDELIDYLTSGKTNDPNSPRPKAIAQTLARGSLMAYFESLPETVKAQLSERWSEREGWDTLPEFIPIAGVQFGNIFVGIQPSRGYDLDPSLNYHAPDLEPTLYYLGFYHWLRTEFGAQSVVHVGKHGNLEWLPGKSIALSETCYPEIALGPLPHFYPFIVNDPGEGTQAKRRAQAVIVDHLTPPLTRAELYGDLLKLEALIDEYYEAQSLDPTRLKPIGDRLQTLLQASQLEQELGLDRQVSRELAPILAGADSYLCELKEAQIRDGLHILGDCPQGEPFRDLILSIARSPGGNRLGLTQAIAKDAQLEFDPVLDPWDNDFHVSEASQTFLISQGELELLEALKGCRHGGDVVAVLENQCQRWLSHYLMSGIWAIAAEFKKARQTCTWIATVLIPLLQQTPQEISNLLRGLDGEYIVSGASGAPTRGRPDVLPTGRNFYGVDIRAIPTETAWDVGRRAAEALVERYTQDHGDYPRSLAISIWGTSTLRTGGDDLAQVLALLGVQPIWDGPSRRLVDFEILPVAVLGRPRVDVTVRISGFFRDSFPNLIQFLHQAIAAVADLAESPDDNPLAAKVQQEQAEWKAQGLEPDQAQKRANYRIFGSKPGAYGAGLQGLIEAQNWQDDQDLARAYLNWSCYAYDANAQGHSHPEVFQARLKTLDIILHNQDNREHDLLDSDDYYQFQGGLTVATRALTGKNPEVYFGDHAIPSRPKIKRLQEEIAKVYRSRVINPKWIAGVMRHGYKGAFEMAATVDYLFAYSATAHCVEDYMYQGVAEAYLFDPQVRAFIQEKNPWALGDMAERLLEAQQRGLWSGVDSQILDQLKAIANHAEGILETQTPLNKT